MNSSNPRVSVVIPVYNTAPYLRRCLDSVCGQTLADIEILCVNDGSPDNAGEILREYAGRDERILVIDFSTNRGVSAARNAAIRMARGEYLGFVDSDDAIDADFYEKLYAKARETGEKIVKGVRIRIAEDGTATEEPLNDWIRRNYLAFTWQWQSAIYQTNFIRAYGIDCPLGVTNAQDVAFLMKALALASGVALADEAYYRYYRRPGSSASDILSHEKILSVLKAYEDIAAFCNTRPVAEEVCSSIIFKSLLLFDKILPRGASGDEERNARAYAEAAIRIYSCFKYREALDARLKAWNPVELACLRKKDELGLVRLWLRGRGAMVAAGLRSRLMKASGAREG